MGLLDEVTKATDLAKSGVPVNLSLLKGLLQVLGSGETGGGLTNIVQGFQQSGLGDRVSSWVSTRPNQPISAEQLLRGLGAGRVKVPIPESPHPR